MWSPREGPRNEAFRQFPTKPWNVEVFQLSLSCSLARLNEPARGGVQKLNLLCAHLEALTMEGQL